MPTREVVTEIFSYWNPRKKKWFRCATMVEAESRAEKYSTYRRLVRKIEVIELSDKKPRVAAKRERLMQEDDLTVHWRRQ